MRLIHGLRPEKLRVDSFANTIIARKIFSNGGTPVFPLTQAFISHEFREACKTAGIANLHFHDLRHEAVSRICEKLPMHEAMRVTGHKTPATLMGFRDREHEPRAEVSPREA
ncbi:MAG TPA: tyrosine-type recombinase/integrase [Burkholderiales bacterium]|nr:tyrosine-type recombinase/integrase [Burkholderiales bacterium]